MMRRAATRSALCRPSFAPTAARGYASVLDAGGKLGEREKAVEDRAIRNHDLELLKKLRDTLGIQVPLACSTSLHLLPPPISVGLL